MNIVNVSEQWLSLGYGGKSSEFKRWEFKPEIKLGITIIRNENGNVHI